MTLQPFFPVPGGGGGGIVPPAGDIGGTVTIPVVEQSSAATFTVDGNLVVDGSTYMDDFLYMGGNPINDLATAAPGDTSSQAATDAFVAAAVNAAVQGLAVKPSVQEATTAALPANTYSNGASGVGATLTAVLPGVLTVDGIAVALLDRVLVQDEVTAANNGIYTVTTLGTVSAAYILTRATDMNQAAEVPGAFAFTEKGTVNAGAGFTVAGAGPYTIGTTAISWTQFSGAGEITAGAGLLKSGNVISLGIDGSGGGGPTVAGLGLGILTVPPGLCGSDQSIGAQIMAVVLVTATVSQVISILGTWVLTAGVTPGAGINQILLWSQSGTLLATTGSMTTAFQSTGFAEGAIANPGGITSYSITEGVNYYLGVVANFTGTTLLLAAPAPTVSTMPILNGHPLAFYFTGITSAGAITPSSGSGTTKLACIYGR